MSATDTQIGGTHYRDFNIQPIKFIQSNGMGFPEGCAVKYVCRWKRKNGVEDLRKAKHYIDLILEDKPYTDLWLRSREKFGHAGMEWSTFCKANGITGDERWVIMHIWYWNATGTRSELIFASKYLDELIAVAAVAA